MKRLCLQRTPDGTPPTRKLGLIAQDHSIKRLLASSTEEVSYGKDQFYTSEIRSGARR
jgi:hypothetical protein